MKPILIGGTGRSGTTVLKRVLSCHSKIVSMRDELRVTVDPGGALDLISALSDRWSPCNADSAMHRFRTLMLQCARANSRVGVFLEKAERKICRTLGVSPRRYLGSGFTVYFDHDFYHQRLEQLTKELCYHVTRGSWIGSPSFQMPDRIFECAPRPRREAARSLERFLLDLYANLARDGQTHWLDDTPNALLHADELLELFPGMRLIHIYRDPRDVTASFRRFSWGGDDFVAIAQRLASIYGRWFEIREKLPCISYLEIGLEGLASDPAAGLRRICEFVGLEYEDSLTRFALNKVHAGRWMRDIPDQDRDQVTHHLMLFLKAYDYLA